MVRSPPDDAVQIELSMRHLPLFIDAALIVMYTSASSGVTARSQAMPIAKVARDDVGSSQIYFPWLQGWCERCV